jgi:hypothetical protein
MDFFLRRSLSSGEDLSCRKGTNIGERVGGWVGTSRRGCGDLISIVGGRIGPEFEEGGFGAEKLVKG